MAIINEESITVSSSNFQPAATAAGMGPFPPGMPVAAAISGLRKTLLGLLKPNWPTQFPTYPYYEPTSKIMGPYTDNVAGTAPPCLIQSITSDFTTLWNLPVDPTAINNMACAMTQQVSDTGGLQSNFVGQTQIDSNQSIFYAIAYAVSVIDDATNEQGVLFVWTATLGQPV